MSLIRYIGQVISLRSPHFWQAWAAPTYATRPVTPENSLTLSAWWRCIRLYADVVGSMPLKFYRRTEGDSREVESSHPVAELLQNPNADQTGQEFWSCMAAMLAINGNAYAEKRYVGTGDQRRLVSLEVLPADTCPERRPENNYELVYYYRDRKNNEQKLAPSDVLHIKGFSLGKMDIGLSPLAAARQALSTTLATDETAGRTFAQGLRSSGFFTGPRLTPEQREDFKKTFIDPIVGNNAEAHYGILEQGFDFKPVNISPKDAEMLLSRRFNVEEICRFMGVPPILVGHSADGQTMWGTGVEAIINMWLTLGLNSFLTAFEKSIAKRLLTPVEQKTFYAEYERNAILRLDSTARADSLQKHINSGLLTPNEGRKLENRPAMAGGDKLLVNSTLVPLESAGTADQANEPEGTNNALERIN